MTYADNRVNISYASLVYQSLSLKQESTDSEGGSVSPKGFGALVFLVLVFMVLDMMQFLDHSIMALLKAISLISIFSLI